MTAKKLRILLTGGGGFVAPYVYAALGNCRADFDLLATSRQSQIWQKPQPDYKVAVLDVTEAGATAAIIDHFQPTHVLHLAGIAAPARADTDPDLAWRVNLGGTLNVARGILAHASSATLIFAGSGLIYGDTAKSGRPLTEADLVQPNSDYAATKAAADLALGALASQGLRVIRCRPFNHTGPGQTEDFVLPSFAAQIARIERGQQQPVLEVGNLDAERDFLDVRDVADAYLRCILRSDDLEPGVIFNIASGVPVSIRSLLDQMLETARVPIRVEVKPERWRANDVPRFVGDATAAYRALGWTAQHDMTKLIATLVDAHRV
jgi:GDP-4-dehydro-6-deoxy-D-mannose reductase